MPRDYAHRSKPKPRRAPANPKRRGAAKAKPVAPVRKIPYLAIAIMVLLFSGFFYLLTFINGSADTHSPQPKEQIKPVTTVAPKPQSKAKLNDEPLPPPPKEDWTYFEELESKTVEVDLPPPEPSQGPYQMQCASFRSREQAEALKARIAFQGKEAMVREVSGKNGVWFKVVLGPYEKKRTAEKDRHVLSRAGISTCKIWKWQG